MILNLPFTKDFYIALDDRGIILEGRIDPLIKIKFWQIPIIYFMNGKIIDKYFNLKMPESYFSK
jgi:hypothetical protein